MSNPENILEILAFVRTVPFSPRFAEIWTMCLLASWNIQPSAGGLVGQPLDLTAATASSPSSSSSSSYSLSPPPPPPFRLLLFLLLFSAPCSEWQQQSQRGRGPLRRPKRGERSSNRWGSRNLPSHHSHSQLTGAPILSLFFLLLRQHHLLFFTTSHLSSCSN